MALTSRITLTGSRPEDPEDYFSSSLAVIFPGDVTNQHGDADHGLLYTSPHLPRPLHISLVDPVGEDDRQLFSHYLWNSSLLLAEMIEAATLDLLPPSSSSSQAEPAHPLSAPRSSFSVAGLSVLELGAGTALPSQLCALLGASRVVVTDYPSPPVLANLRANVERNVRPENSPLGRAATPPPVAVVGHGWGDLSDLVVGVGDGDGGGGGVGGGFDRVLVADCLWMPWQHDGLRRSVAGFLGRGPRARAWVVAGLHTGREAMRGFFGEEELRLVGLEVEWIWERDCDGLEREWAWDRGVEDVIERKRWLVVAVLRRIPGGDG
ncbi:nicotinamide N-methyltransferase [Phialemonium atrogriseum]|uniref:Nicotinamide N-methyltransferase n=1 Tax=Phialemonium atrogriseum TaxID=1093897 RepID=A0AAJ0C5R7_9PEZI|nr:nicotinamide N-methyltransferase [Phialemonium atrogriseum]KAK1770679.1 nicotinamide N-methyltransferase [Phialemonium atrogriseum]